MYVHGTGLRQSLGKFRLLAVLGYKHSKNWCGNTQKPKIGGEIGKKAELPSIIPWHRAIKTLNN